MNTLKLLAAASVIFVMGCAQTPADESASVANAEGVVCTRSPEMGSRLDRRTCTTRAERAEAARITKEEVINRQRVDSVKDSMPMPSAGN